MAMHLEPSHLLSWRPPGGAHCHDWNQSAPHTPSPHSWLWEAAWGAATKSRLGAELHETWLSQGLRIPANTSLSPGVPRQHPGKCAWNVYSLRSPQKKGRAAPAPSTAQSLVE